MSEAGLTVFLACAVALLGATFYLGVLVGREKPVAAVGTVAATPAPVRSPASLPSPGRGPAERRLPRRFVGPPPRPSPAPVGGTPGASLRGAQGTVAIEVAAVPDMEEARVRYLGLLGQGFPAYLLPTTEAGKAVYRVRVGDYVSEEQALAVGRQLRESEGLEARVVK